MSSFYCEVCGKPILDSPEGYTTECVHYPKSLFLKSKHKGELMKKKAVTYRFICNICGRTIETYENIKGSFCYGGNNLNRHKDTQMVIVSVKPRHYRAQTHRATQVEELFEKQDNPQAKETRG